MENLRDLQEEARSLERAGRDAAAADLYDRILSDPAGARLGGMWAARARHRLRAGDVAAAAADMAASAERYETAGLKNLSLAQWRGALQAHAEGPAEWVLRSARVAMAEGYLRDARRGYAAFADRAEAAGRTEEAVQALREYLAAAPDDSAARRRLSALTGEPEPEPAASPVLEPARPEPEAEHAVADPLPGLVPTAPADPVVADPDEARARQHIPGRAGDFTDDGARFNRIAIADEVPDLYCRREHPVDLIHKGQPGDDSGSLGGDASGNPAVSGKGRL